MSARPTTCAVALQLSCSPSTTRQSSLLSKALNETHNNCVSGLQVMWAMDRSVLENYGVETASSFYQANLLFHLIYCF